MPKDFHIWVEVAQRKRKCHQCGEDINKGTMFVRMGHRDKPLRASAMCATCFDTIMSELSHEFHEIKEAAWGETSDAPACAGPRCFVCGLAPEKCQCAPEAYR